MGRSAKFIDLIEASLAAFAFVTIIGITFFVVRGLTPVGLVLPQVAGVSTQSFKLEWQNLYQAPNHDVNYKYDENSGSIVYKITMPQLVKNFNNEPLISIINSKTSQETVSFAGNVKGYVQDILKVYLVAGDNRFLLNKNKTYSLNIPAGKDVKIYLETETFQRINFPVEVDLLIW